MALRQDNASEGAASFEILKTGPFFDQAAPFLGGPNVTHPYPNPTLKKSQCRFDESKFCNVFSYWKYANTTDFHQVYYLLKRII